MPYYSQREDLNYDEQRLVELTDSADAVGVPDEDLIERLGVEADTTIDGLLAGVYVTPVATPFPAILKYIHADLWRMYLYKHRENMETPAEVLRGFNASMADLRAYFRKDEFLPCARVQSRTAPNVGGGGFSADSCNRIFGRRKDSLGG